MPKYENKLFKRIKGEDGIQDVFKTDRLEYDLSEMRFLHAGIDTIRQLYTCTLKTSVFSAIERHQDKNSGNLIDVGGIEWKLTSSGKKSGYQYIFKNLDINEAGVVVMFKSFYKEADQRGSHLKIEATPQLIDELGLEKLSKRLRQIGNLFGETLEASGVAVHLACDMKGLDLPDDFERRLVCRAKRSFKIHGVSGISADLQSISATYGQGETYVFGSSGALQLCLYDKSKEALASGKMEFWESVWRRTLSLEHFPNSEYQGGERSETGEPDQVHRLEFRIHHSVIQQFENGHFNATGETRCIREAVDLVGHVDSLWAYCLNNFRLHHSDTYVHPIWQKIEEDVRFVVPGRWDDGFVYKRSPKASAGAPKRNVAMMLGNALSLAARRGLDTDWVVNWFLNSGLESELSDYFGLLRFRDDSELWFCLREFVERKLTEHRVNGVAA